jgi:hypothetical protein
MVMLVLFLLQACGGPGGNWHYAPTLAHMLHV